MPFALTRVEAVRKLRLASISEGGEKREALKSEHKLSNSHSRISQLPSTVGKFPSTNRKQSKGKVL